VLQLSLVHQQLVLVHQVASMAVLEHGKKNRGVLLVEGTDVVSFLFFSLDVLGGLLLPDLGLDLISAFLLLLSELFVLDLL